MESHNLIPYLLKDGETPWDSKGHPRAWPQQKTCLIMKTVYGSIQLAQPNWPTGSLSLELRVPASSRRP